MAFERLTKDARAMVADAHGEARADSRGFVEAEHLLLALAHHPELHHLGLERGELCAALARETSLKLALERAMTLATQRGDRRITVRHLLAGVLAAERGRVPRALELAGVDIQELRARVLSA